MRVYAIILAIVIFIVVLGDLAVFSTIKKVFVKAPRARKVALWTHWIIAFCSIAALIIPFTIPRSDTGSFYFIWIIGFFFLLYIPKLILGVFWLVQQLVNLFRKKKPKKHHPYNPQRRDFITNVGIVASSIPFLGISSGMLKGRLDFKIRKTKLYVPNLPEAFNGFKIAQISDTHLGNFGKSFSSLSPMRSMINREDVDIFVHTGDLVNNFASEIDGWHDLFKGIQSKGGKFAVMGNHDYGDYSEWATPQAKAQNLQTIRKGFRSLGFTLLENDNRTIQRGKDKLSIVGVENWGNPPFPRYGNLEQALEGCEGDLKILLSHDPSHWEEELYNKYPEIPLTLSGHTHGMQTGFSWNGKTWSPASLKYKYWGGIYHSSTNSLYVNRGIGYVGVPIRIGMPPEISIITLTNKRT